MVLRQKIIIFITASILLSTHFFSPVNAENYDTNGEINVNWINPSPKPYYLNDLSWNYLGTEALIVGDYGDVFRFENGALEQLDISINANFIDVEYSPVKNIAYILDDDFGLWRYKNKVTEKISSNILLDNLLWAPDGAFLVGVYTVKGTTQTYFDILENVNITRINTFKDEVQDIIWGENNLDILISTKSRLYHYNGEYVSEIPLPIVLNQRYISDILWDDYNQRFLVLADVIETIDFKDRFYTFLYEYNNNSLKQLFKTDNLTSTHFNYIENGHIEIFGRDYINSTYALLSYSDNSYERISTNISYVKSSFFNKDTFIASAGWDINIYSGGTIRDKIKIKGYNYKKQGTSCGIIWKWSPQEHVGLAIDNCEIYYYDGKSVNILLTQNITNYLCCENCKGNNLVYIGGENGIIGIYDSQSDRFYYEMKLNKTDILSNWEDGPNPYWVEMEEDIISVYISPEGNEIIFITSYYPMLSGGVTPETSIYFYSKINGTFTYIDSDYLGSIFSPKFIVWEPHKEYAIILYDGLRLLNSDQKSMTVLKYCNASIEQYKNIYLSPNEKIWSFAVKSDPFEIYFLTYEYINDRSDIRYTIRKLIEDQELIEFTIPSYDSVSGLFLKPGSNVLYLPSGNGTIYLFDGEKLIRQKFDTTDRFGSMYWCKSGEYALIKHGEELYVYTGKYIFELKRDDIYGKIDTIISISNNGFIITIGNKILFFNGSRSTILYEVNYRGRFRDATLLDNNSILLVGDNGWILKIELYNYSTTLDLANTTPVRLLSEDELSNNFNRDDDNDVTNSNKWWEETSVLTWWIIIAVVVIIFILVAIIRKNILKKKEK